MSQIEIDDKVYEVTLPDGSDIPDDWTDDQILAYFDDHGPKVDKPKTPEVSQSMGMGDMFSRAGSNFAQSGLKAGKDLVEMLKHPVDTAKSIYELGKGVVQLAIPGEQGNEDMARTVGQHFKNRYGTIENAKRTFATDPVGFALDATGVASMGGTAVAGLGRGIAKVGQIGGKATTALQRVGSTAGALPKNMLTRAGEGIAQAGRSIRDTANLVDPLSASARLAGGIGTGAGKAIAAIEGKLTGVGHDVVEQTFKAGLRRSKDWVKGFKDVEDADVLVREARKNIKDLAVNAQGRYVHEFNKMVKSAPPVDWKPIAQKLDDMVKSTFDPVVGEYSQVSSAAEMGKLKLIAHHLHQVLADPRMHNAAGFDHLKKILNRIKISDDMDTAQRVRTTMANAVKQEISKVYKQYDGMMDQYSRFKDLSSDLKQAFGSEKHTAMDTTLRKLQAAMRNQVNTSMGNKRKLLAEIDPTGKLADKIAGQAMREIMPRGLMGIGGTAAAGGLTFYNPLAGAALFAMESPNLMGRTIFNVGRVASPFVDFGKALGPTGGRVLGRSGILAGRYKQAEDKKRGKRN